MRTIISLFLLLFITTATAQTDLTGRIYYNANVMAGKMRDVTKELKEKMGDAKAEAIKKAEEKKKRKLTAAEKEDVEKEVEDGQKMIEAIMKGTKTAVTITFKDKETVVMKMEMKVDDEAMKNAGIGWAKRKLIQAATAVSPSEKSKYTVQGDMIITTDGKEKDTMYLSNDGKYLSGMMDKDTPIKLTRTK